MPSSAFTSKVVQFGVFELDLQKAELRKQGVRVKLQAQSLKVLQVLSEHPGQIVSREQLRTHIWPANTFVEFDQGLYSAMARLRDALGDSSESPRFIETVARRGYRFIAPVTVGGVESGQKITSPTEKLRAELLRSVMISLLAGLAGGAILIAILLGFDVAGVRRWLLRRSSSPITQTRLTDFVGLEEFPTISPDGKTVAFSADNAAYRQLWLRLIAGGKALQLTHDNADHLYPRWSPDSSRLIYYSPPAQGEEQGTLWEISALGGAPRPLGRSVSGADISHEPKNLARPKVFQLYLQRCYAGLLMRAGNN
jgi:DNA-binding winged helix-turn-helix (wHTH) protein